MKKVITFKDNDFYLEECKKQRIRVPKTDYEIWCKACNYLSYSYYDYVPKALKLFYELEKRYPTSEYIFKFYQILKMDKHVHKGCIGLYK